MPVWVGDVVLKQFSECLTEDLRSTDTVARIGGEEFAIILPETTDEAAVELAERLRIKIEKHECKIERSRSLHITASVGVGSYRSEMLTESELLRRADKALYQAKNSGRNKVCLYQSDE